MELIIGIGGLVVGSAVTWAITHFYARREERSLALLPQQVAQTLIPQLVQRGFIEKANETAARAVTREVLSSSWGTTQYEMNQASRRDFAKADAELGAVHERLRAYIPPDERELLDEAQEAWKAFRDKDVRFAGALYKGGTIQPLIQNSAALGLTRERLAELEQTYNHRRLLTEPYQEK